MARGVGLASKGNGAKRDFYFGGDFFFFFGRNEEGEGQIEATQG